MKSFLSRLFPSAGARATPAPTRRPRLELLEDRAVPAVLHVTNMTSDSPITAGTLRFEIDHSSPGDTIDIDVAGTLHLTHGALTPSNALTIKGLGPTRDVLVAGGTSRIIEDVSGPLSLSGLTLTGASTHTYGGAIASFGGPLTINDCTITGNKASYFGAAICSVGGLTITNSTVSGNSTTLGDGGGIYSYGDTKIVNSTISGNHAGTGPGGGLEFISHRESDDFSLTITGSTISGNTASCGAGVYAGYGIGTSTIANSTITGNTATRAGGGLDVIGHGTLNLVNDTVVGNTGRGGGGIALAARHGPTTNLLNTIVANNTDGTNHAPDISGTVTATHSLIRSKTGVTFLGSTSTDVFGVDPHLGPLQNNGGPTMTMALLAGSLAINAGDDSVLGGPYSLTTDQRGHPRKVGVHVDIGAFECQPPPPPPPPPAPPPPPPPLLPARRGRIF